MSGSFDVTTTNYLAFTAGSAGAVGSGAYTIAALVNPAAGNNNAGFAAALASATITRDLFEDANALFGTNDFSSGFGTLTQGTWYLVAQCKAAGSATYRHHLWAYASDGSGTMSHGVATGSSNQGDGSTTTVLRIGSASVKANGLIAVVGYWTRVLSDAELDSMKSNLLTSWRDVSGGQPKELIHLQNWNGTSGATVAIGTSTFSSVTGTVSSGANPTSFDFSLGGTNATATPSTVAAVTAVPSATLSTGETVSASTVAAVAAVPAPTVRLSVAITPATVAAVTAVPAPTMRTDQTAAPSTVVAVAAVGTSVMSTGATAAPATVAAVAGIGSPAVSAGGGTTIAPATVAAVAAVDAPAVNTSSRVSPAAVVAVAAVGAPTVRLSALIVPATVAAIAAVGAASVSTTRSAIVTVGTVTAVAGVPAAVISALTVIPEPDIIHIVPAPLVHILAAPPVHAVAAPLVHVGRSV